jgi:hypothetical protein
MEQSAACSSSALCTSGTWHLDKEGGIFGKRVPDVPNQQLLVKKVKESASSCRTVRIPPGFKDMQGTSNTTLGVNSKATERFCLHSSHPNSRQFQPRILPYICGTSQPPLPSQAQPSLFSVALCEEYRLPELKEVGVLRETVMMKLFCEFDSLAFFNFSSHSPDDTVKDKQIEGFSQAYS